MRKFTFAILLIVCTMFFVSCYQDLERTSLQDYIDMVERSNVGYSSVEIDHPDCFLPSNTFIQDYSYSQGEFYWREDDPFRSFFDSDVRPEISFLRLQYEDEVYYNAKRIMLEENEPYGDRFYTYNDYVFYESTRWVEFNGFDEFPTHFTMSCYNDENKTLIFIGFYSGTMAGTDCIEKKFLEDIEGNWMSFIDTYFGECYDFSK